MYVYAFDRWFGHDRVATISGFSGQPGDLLSMGDEYFLVLGDQVAFSEFGSQYSIGLHAAEVEIAGLCSHDTLELLHWFVEHRFTSYKQSIPLWLGRDITQIVKRAPDKKLKKSSTKLCFALEQQQLITSNHASGQQLVVVPNVFAQEHVLSLWPKNNSDILRLTSQMTLKQKAEAFRSIKQGASKVIVTTYSQMFQDRFDLQSIILIDEHMRYYKHQQEPRYHAVECVEKMAELNDVTLEKTGWQLS